MKSSGVISSAVNNSGTWTITTTATNNLENYFKVKIGSYYYRVANVTNTTFTIETTRDLSTETAWEMYINYDFGSREEVAMYQSLKGNNQKSDEKYDLIWLFNDITENIPEEINNVEKEVEIIIAFVTNSLQEYTSEYRLENIFKKRLIPLYDLFIKKLKKSDDIIIDIGEQLPIEKHNRYIYGENENVLNEVTDAIEIKTTLKIKKIITNEC